MKEWGEVTFMKEWMKVLLVTVILAPTDLRYLVSFPIHSEAIGESEPGPVHNLIGMTALVMWPKLLYSVKLDSKLTF